MKQSVFIIKILVLFIVHVLFLIIGIEMFCKIRGEFVMNTKSETKEKIDVVQAAHSRVGLFFQVRAASFLTLAQIGLLSSVG